MKNLIFTICSLILSASLFAQDEELLFSPKGIAEIHITLSDGKKIEDIKNEKQDEDYVGKLNATMTIENSASSSYEGKDFYNGKILIEGRGNTTWGVPKRPYNIDLVTNSGSDSPSPLLGMPTCNEWALMAFWHDRSLMRLPFASYLGQHLDKIPWAARVRYAEVWINGEYRGLYCLSEKVQRDDNRAKLKKLDASSTDLSGGYILEASPEDGHKSKPIEVQTQIKTSREGINFTFKYPKAKNVTEAQRKWIKDYMDEFESVLRSNDYKDPVNGYQKYLNDDSFIDWTILHEMSKGCDNLFHASVFVQKDRNGKLDMGSPWDFDLSYGNSGVNTENGNWIRMHRWFGRLYQDERYAKKYNARYDELMSFFDKIPEILQANYKQLESAGVLDREKEKFPQILSGYKQDATGSTNPTTYKGHVQYLCEWIMSRNNWDYISLGLTNEEKGSRMKAIKPVIRIMEPEIMERGDAFTAQLMKSDDNNNKFTYSWNDSQSYITNSSRRITRAGKYWVRIKDEWGNISQVSDTLYFGVEKPSSSAINTIFAGENSVTYSNPAVNWLNIHFTSLSESQITVQLFNLNGVLVKSENIPLTAGYNNIQTKVSDLKGGIYVLRMVTSEGVISRKISILN